MKMIRKTLALLIVLSLLCLASACAEDVYWDNTTRIPGLYEESAVTFNDEFSLTLPSAWQTAELPDADIANGILTVTADDLDSPKLRLTVSTYTADECSNIFGGTDYNTIFASLANTCTDTTSVRINDLWTVLYSTNDGVKTLVIIDIPMANGIMYQVKFEVYSITAIDVMNNIIKSLQTAQ